MAPLLPKAAAGRGTLHPEGNQECAHTNKTHTSVISLPGHLLWAELAFSPVFFSPGSHLYFVHMTLFSQSPVSDWFCSLSTNQPMSAAIPSYRDVGSTLSFLLLALACQAGLHILGTDTSHLSKANTPWDNARAMWRGRRVPAAARLCREELGEWFLFQGGEFSSIC